MRIKPILKLCTASILLFTGLVLADQQEGAHAKTDSSLLVNAFFKEPQVWLGEAAVFRIDVLSSQGWATLDTVPELVIDGGYALRIETQGTRLSENRDGKSYSGQRYEFYIFGQHAKRLSVPALPLSVDVKQWGASTAGDSTVPITAYTTPVFLDVMMPSGAPKKFVSGPSVRFSQSWQAGEEALAVGDAVVRNIEFEITDSSGMVIPPLELTPLNNVHVYLADPEVVDKISRGSLIGKRKESITYLFEKIGTFTTPDLELAWWNTKTESFETLTITGRTFNIAESRIVSTSLSDNDFISKFTNVKNVFWALLIIFVIVVLKLNWRRTLWVRWCRRYAAWSARRTQSEAYLFSSLLRAIKRNDNTVAFTALYLWFDSLETSMSSITEWLNALTKHPSINNSANQGIGQNSRECKHLLNWLSQSCPNSTVSSIVAPDMLVRELRNLRQSRIKTRVNYWRDRFFPAQSLPPYNI